MDILTNLPCSELKVVIEEKYKGQGKKYADLFAELPKVSSLISQELRHINELFSEYTPHDKEFHITNLFRISDILLGKEKYEKMNIVELYLLIVAMYAHDWGMAVSKAERHYIATKNIQDEGRGINLLDDEFNRFEQYINSKLGKTNFSNDDEIGIDVWQEYIRNTHALRSGKRIEKYFEKINGSIASALSKICVGHWLEIQDISERRGYYKDASVFGETINLRALTIYIRLIDLFDLAEDRTPYVIWKYVNPQNEYSQMEWNKHRALHQITCPNYGSGRVICISGSTDNHEVYAALLDLKSLCERYFRECLDALAHMNDKRHELGVIFLDWRIEARNFKPIEVAFDFEKENIFKTLSEEIYDCHPYVYIRELIQNSVDAITLRKEVLNRKKVGGDNIGYICIDVKRVSGEDLEISCQDDGIGMDEYILKNYFSVLGKSYYSSNDFKNKRLDMSPISKFGIGVLSCFSVAKQMEIYTKREPYMNEGREGLKVVINDIRRQFRVEELPDYKCEIGTIIKLKIKMASLEKFLEKNEIKTKDYNIANYVKEVTDFVKYPIIIREDSKKVIIVPSEYDIGRLADTVEDINQYEIYTKSSRYPVEKRVMLQDIENFEKIFSTRRFDLSKDFKLQDVEGTITFALLKDFADNIFNSTHCWPTSEIQVQRNKKNYRIRWKDNNIRVVRNRNIIWCDFIEIFNKGFMLEKEQSSFNEGMFDLRSHLFPAPYIRVNYKNKLSDISVSRFERKESLNIVDIIWDELTKYISEEWRNCSISYKDYQYWKALTVFLTQYHVSISKMEKEIFQNAKFPFIDHGKITYKEIIGMDTVNLLPNQKADMVIEYCNNNNVKLDDEQWNYGECILIANEGRYFSESLCQQISSYMRDVLKLQYALEYVRFLDSQEYEYPISQQVWTKNVSKDTISHIVDLLSEWGRNSCEDDKELRRLYDSYNKFVRFDDESNHFFAYGCKLLNIEHPIARNLIIYKWLLFELQKREDIDKKELAEIKDVLEDFPFFERESDESWDMQYSFSDINEGLAKIHEWLRKYYTKLPKETISISSSDFIPKSVLFYEKERFSKIKGVETGR